MGTVSRSVPKKVNYRGGWPRELFRRVVSPLKSLGILGE
jgi:hypothetical protein